MKKRIIGLNYRNKKGLAIMEIMFVMIILFVFGFISMIIFQTYKEISPDLRSEFVSSGSNSSVVVVDDVTNRYPSTFDALVLICLILLWIVVLVSAFLVDSHPLFFIASIIVFVFILIAGGILGQFYDELIVDDSLSGLSDDFPITNWILEHLFFLILLVGFSVLLVLYGRGRF